MIESISEASDLDALARVLVGGVGALVSQRLHAKVQARVAIVRPDAQSAMVFEEFPRGPSHGGVASGTLAGPNNGAALSRSRNASRRGSALAVGAAVVWPVSEECVASHAMGPAPHSDVERRCGGGCDGCRAAEGSE